MKKKKVFSKILAIVLVLSLMLSAFPNLSVFAQESSSKEKLTEKGELWQPESNSNALNFEGDLSIEELQSAKLNDEDTPEIVGQDNVEEKGHVKRLREQEPNDNTIVFQNRDGTKTAYFFSNPVKYTDKNGNVNDKRTKLDIQNIPAKYSEKYGYVNQQNDIKAYFPKHMTTNQGMLLESEDISVELIPDHIHMLVSIPPYISIAQFMGYLKGKSSLMIFYRHANLKYKYASRNFWRRGYYVDTVGRNKKAIAEYIKNQLEEDFAAEQMSIKEYIDPFTGDKRK